MKQIIEIERRWALPTKPIVPVSFQNYLLTQYYLQNSENKVERIRQSIGSETQFYHTIKTPIPDQIGQYEQEAEITLATYTELLKRVKLDVSPITKERMVFEWNGLKYELDSFLYPVQFYILEVEIPTIDTAVEIPKFLEPVIEITGKLKLSNFRIAKDPKAASKVMKKILADAL